MSELFYDQASVVAAAKNTIQDIRARRAEALMEWDAKSGLGRFIAKFIAMSESRYSIEHGSAEQEETCERLIFKAESSLHKPWETQWGMPLTDYEMDCVRNFWGMKLQPPPPPPNRIIKRGF